MCGVYKRGPGLDLAWIIARSGIISTVLRVNVYLSGYVIISGFYTDLNIRGKAECKKKKKKRERGVTPLCHHHFYHCLLLLRLFLHHKMIFLFVFKTDDYSSLLPLLDRCTMKCFLVVFSVYQMGDFGAG